MEAGPWGVAGDHRSLPIRPIGCRDRLAGLGGRLAGPNRPLYRWGVDGGRARSVVEVSNSLEELTSSLTPARGVFWQAAAA